MPNSDFLFRGSLAELDADVAELIRHETARQARYLILIPSESTVPAAVREALASPFHNLYAEGYPLDETRTMSQAEILDYNARLPEYRRIADKRYYKGTEYADIVEALARRRAAELFAPPGLKPEQLFVNVQPLSGAPANNAVYSALLNIGDTVMGLDLLHGGHLTHGSPVNRSGKNYNIVSYGVSPETELLDYDAIRALALEHRPKMIIAGYTSYPYAPDWSRFRAIADEVGAYLLADVSHVSGLIVGGVYPNPVGIADVVMFTTHKTLAGPRGAVIITHKSALAGKIDRAVFPGEQGGPHINAMAALAVALRLAHTEQFRELQKQTVANAARLAQKLAEHGLRIPHGGTDTHLLLVDCKTIVGPDGTPLSGDMGARILDLAGIVLNRNTIPGDRSALSASGLRIGTPWVTQRGFGFTEIDRLAEIIAGLLKACVPYSYSGKKRPELRAKVDFDALYAAKNAVRDLAASVGIDTEVQADGYPHFYYLEREADTVNWQTLIIRGETAAPFLQAALTSDVYALKLGETQPTRLLHAEGGEITRGLLERADGEYRLHVERRPSYAAAWLRALSDGFTLFDATDPYAKVPGPVDVQLIGRSERRWNEKANDAGYDRKAYFVGINGAHYAGPKGEPLPVFAWEEPAEPVLKQTTLNALHREMGAKMVEFAGYDMPVWYSSVMDEHLAVRSRAGVFDVTHMGVFDAVGPGALDFLDAVTTNDVSKLAVGESHYTYLLDVNGIPIDDLMIYRVEPERYLMVVNASNNDKNWAWLNAVKAGQVQIDPHDPQRRLRDAGDFMLRDLRDPALGAEMRVDVALQGPAARDVLLALDGSEADKNKVSKLPWAGVTHVNLGGYDMIVSRTGYTGERVAFELFVHPDRAPELFRDLVQRGAVPCGLAARDSLRTEAGLPLYGHELAGPLNLNPADAGFSSYVKLWKPFFIGKAAYITHEREREAEVTRFRLDNKGARPAHQGDPVLDKKGRVVGFVTSCSLDSEGWQLGQVYLHEAANEEGTPVLVYAGSSRVKPGKTPGELKLGDKTPLPEQATILSRFPKKK
ncbi:MAG: serine hydroxymethyltransferase [Chloroflexi bacterium]|nr:serine hydroxymethyltransferase [Chloroflexota bacterium]MDL1884204.1 serine hydroxymethyltransferase [Anaerolineae bacterium CFX8]